MARTIAVVVLQQKVYHDGHGMNVLNPGADNAKVDEKDVADLVKEGVIADPNSDAVRGAYIGGYADGGTHTGPGDDSVSQPIGSFTEAQERSLAEQSSAAGSPSGSDAGSDEVAALRQEVAELRGVVAELRDLVYDEDGEEEETSGSTTTAGAGADTSAADELAARLDADETGDEAVAG